MGVSRAAARGAVAMAAALAAGLHAQAPVRAPAGAQAPAATTSGATSREFRYLMGTSVAVEATGGDETVRRQAIDGAFAAMAEVDRLMSNYREDSELTSINRSAAARPVAATDPMISVIEAAARVSALSGGAFDVTVGPLVALWGFHDKKPHLPTPAELAEVRPLVDYRQLIVDPAAHTVRFARAGMAIDLGGIAKGFAVELAAGVLRDHRLTGSIDAGGNEYLLGTPPGKASWTIGVKDPDAPDRLLGTIRTPETSVSTSAAYANYLTINGRAYGHILDPRTLQPSTASLSATVLSRDGTMADALSTAAFVLGPSAGLQLIDQVDGAAGLIAYRRPDGRVGMAVSRRMAGLFSAS